MERAHVPLTQFTPVVTPCKTMVRYQNQDADLGTVQIQNISITPRILNVTLSQTSPPSSHLQPCLNPQQLPVRFPFLQHLSYQECCIHGILQYVTWNWLYSLRIILWRFIQIVCVPIVYCLFVHFFFQSVSSIPWYGHSIVCDIHHSPVEGHMSSSCLGISQIELLQYLYV